MIIDTDSEEMRWILLKFLKDSLDFLSDSPYAKKTNRGIWAKIWMDLNLTDEEMKNWMPEDDH